MNEQQLKKLHEYELVILDEFVKFCDENGLKYYLTGGSALGAVRHHGFIPWDDDIDICLTRKDYEFLIKNYKDNDKFYLQCIERDSNYWNMFAKIRMRNTLMEEKIFVGRNLPKEIFIDIFPIDNAPSGGYKQIKIQANLVRILKTALFYKFRLTNLKGYDYKLATKICSLLPKKTIYGLCKKIMTSYEDDNSEYVVAYLGAYAIKKEYLTRSTYFETVLAEFEGKKYMIPKDVDKYLSTIYGDYMTLPPLEKRINHNVGRISFDTTKDI